jgi:peptidoglycan-N-acetylglucosamine deacetylase
MFWTNPSILRTFFPWILWKGPPDAPDVFLTFDDGPHPEHTAKVLDILKHEKAAASFFLNGRNVLLHPGIADRIRAEGHAIGSHGHSHCRLDWKKKGLVLSEIDGSDKAIEKAAGLRPVFFRPPYGRFDPRFRGWMRKSGHTLVMWSLMAGDFLEMHSETLIDRICRSMHPGAVVVLHDGHSRAPAMISALPGLIRRLKAAGYGFKSLDALIGADHRTGSLRAGGKFRASDRSL